jgi:tetratricopeptide (TPR) repeat protein
MKSYLIALELALLVGASSRTLFSAETTTHIASPSQHAATPASNGSGAKIAESESENQLTIGKSSSDNLIFRSAAEYQLRQDADAVKKLEGIREIRGGSNQWEEVSRLLQGVLATDTSKDIKRDIKRMALLELAGGSESNGQIAQAQQFLAEYVQRYDTDTIIPEVLLRQGYLYRKMGAYEKAISKFYDVMTAALRLKGNLVYYARVVLTAQSEIAETMYIQGKYSDAVEKYQRLLNVKEEGEELNRVAVQTKLIRCLAKLANHSEVVKQANDFFNQFSNSENQAEVRYLLATSYKALGEKQQALNQLLLLLEAVEVSDQERATKLKSWKMLAGNEIGNQLFLEGDFMGAIQVYKGLLRLDNSMTWMLPIHYQIGLCFERLLQPVEAIKTYDEIINLGQKSDSKLDENLQMVVDMARFRYDILSWKNSLDRTTLPSVRKVAEKTP